MKSANASLINTLGIKPTSKKTTQLAKTRVLPAKFSLYLVMSSSAAWEQSRICDTSSVARSGAGWMYRLVRRTGFPESHFCLSSQDFRVLSKAYLKPGWQGTVMLDLGD